MGARIEVRPTDQGSVWLGIDDTGFLFNREGAVEFKAYLWERLSENAGSPTISIQINDRSYSGPRETIQRIREAMLRALRE